jgi:hypothetical protein
LIVRVIDFPKKGNYITSFDEYVQHEAHFRLYESALRRTITFDRRTHSCRVGENKCTVTRRWFYHYRFGPVSTIPGAIAVEAEGVAENRAHGVFRSDVEDRNLKFKSCSTMLLNEKTHQLEPSPPPPSSIDACGNFAQSQPSAHQ